MEGQEHLKELEPCRQDLGLKVDPVSSFPIDQSESLTILLGPFLDRFFFFPVLG